MNHHIIGNPHNTPRSNWESHHEITPQAGITFSIMKRLHTTPVEYLIKKLHTNQETKRWRRRRGGGQSNERKLRAQAQEGGPAETREMEGSSLNRKHEETGKVERKVLGLWNLGVAAMAIIFAFIFVGCVLFFSWISLSRHYHQSFPPATRSNRQDVLVHKEHVWGVPM